MSTENIPLEQLLKKKIKQNRFKIVADIILIIFLILIFLYVYSEIESFKELGKDVCRLCEAKTGGVCLKESHIYPDVTTKESNINETELLAAYFQQQKSDYN